MNTPQAAAAAAIASGSTSFALASRLFDPQTRIRVRLLYAWCRHCDDTIDGQLLGRGAAVVSDSAAALHALRTLSLLAVNGDGRGGTPFEGLARVVAETGLPAQYVADHLAGYQQDVSGQVYETLADMLEYCYHVAGVVGLMMAWIMGIRDDETLLRGCDLGLAFQLTNIARDVSDDAQSGRVYLPSQWLQESHANVTMGQPLDAHARHAIVPLVSRLLGEADRYYQSASHGIAQLPPRSAWAVATARHVYADIGREVRRRGARAWDTRVATSRRRKLLRLVQALGETAWPIVTARRTAAPRRDGLWTPPRDRVLR